MPRSSGPRSQDRLKTKRLENLKISLSEGVKLVDIWTNTLRSYGMENKRSTVISYCPNANIRGGFQRIGVPFEKDLLPMVLFNSGNRNPTT